MVSNPDPIDIHVGGRVKERRTMLGMSQKSLGDALGLTFQQIQKYERGASRIGSGRLWRIATILDVPVSFFFDGLESNRPVGSPIGDDSEDRKLFEAAKRLSSVDEAAVRQAMYGLINALGRSIKNKAGKD